MSKRSARFGLGGTNLVVSAVLLALEVAHVRLLSYATDPRLVYAAIGIALAGLGGGAIWVSVRPELARGRVRRRLMWLCTALALAILLGSALFARLSPYFSASDWTGIVGRALPILVVCAVPYAVGGVILSITVAAAGGSAHRVYALGLVGSALGCFALFPFMRGLGLEPLLSLLAGGAAAAALAIGREAGSRLLPAGAALGLCALAVPLSVWLMPFVADPGDLLGVAKRAYRATHPGTPAGFEPARDFAGWDPVSRVEVFTFPGDFGRLNGTAPIKLVTQDGGAGTILVGFGGHDDARDAWTRRSVYATGYLLAPRPKRALVIGLGGGVDVVTALAHGAGQVTGVEINATILEVASRRFAAFQGHVLSRPEVTLVHADGRSFVEQSHARGERWSLIQMSGADTYSAGGTGAFMFSESYLYTVEAFERYLGALEPRGVLALIRFGPEPLRAVVTAAAALRRLGAKQPERHFVVLRQGICAGIAIGRRPLSRRAVERMTAAVAASQHGSRVSLPMWQAMGFGIDQPLQLDYAPGRTPGSLFERAMTASGPDLDKLLAALPLDYAPATDDRPFFFQFLKPADWRHLAAFGPDDFFASGLLGHGRFVLGFLLLAAFATLAPLGLSRRRVEGKRRLAFFGCLGLGYMMLELALIQRTVLLLGHPTHSVSVTLASLLVASGAGAWLSGHPRVRRAPARHLYGAVLGIVLLAVGYQLGLGAVGRWLLVLPWLARAAALVLLVFPLGLLMGMPFAMGLAASRDQPALIAWGLGVNGFCGVLGSLLAVPLAMLQGFGWVTLVAAACYPVAALFFPRQPTAVDP